MQYGPLGGAVRVVIASDAPQAVAELDKLASYADQVSLVGFIRHPQDLDEDLEALLPDLVLLYTGFGGGDTIGLAGYLASRSAHLRVMVVVDPDDELFIARLEDAGAATVGTDADPATLVAAIRGAVALPAPPEDAEPAPSWPGLAPRVLWPEEPAAEYGGPALPEPFPPAEYGGPSLAGQLPPDEYAGPSLAEQSPAAGPSPAPEPAPEPFAAPEPFPAPEPLPVPQPFPAPEGPVAAPPPTYPTGTPWAEEQAPEEPAIPSSVPVFQLDTTAFEAPVTSGPQAAWPGVSTASPAIPAAPAPPMAAEPEAEPVAAARPRPPRRHPGGTAELVVVFSGKGGVGKSLIATNLAVALAAGGERVALVDLDLQFGDVAVMLHVESHTTAIDALAQQGDQIDSDFIEEVMATGPEGVRALLAPASPEFADLVNTANLRAILRELAKGYDHIVVDTPSHLEERNLEAIEMADQIIVVTSFNFPAIKDTKVTLKLLQSLGVDREKICVVLNQTRAKVTFQRAEVEDSLRFRVLVVLPFEPRVDDCIDNGRQMVTAEPKAEFSKQFQVLVDHIAGNEGGQEAKEAERPRPRANRRRFSVGRG
ncbi:MAG: P-loop NTPase [Candidatus Dormibacteria bacterium]|jgi:MinD-like ATPase involved in chromosome partitioning or flagellar assembly